MKSKHPTKLKKRRFTFRLEGRTLEKWKKHLKTVKPTTDCFEFGIEDYQFLYLTPCIYFLKLEGKVVYVGETNSLCTRLSAHNRDVTKIFDSFDMVPFEGSNKERKSRETYYIRKYNPEYNTAKKKRPTGKGARLVLNK